MHVKFRQYLKKFQQYRYLNPRLRYHCFRLLETIVRRIEIQLPVLILTSSPSSVCDSAPACEIDDQRQNYDVIPIFQHGGHTVANLLPFSDVVTSHFSEGRQLFAYQISTRYLNAWLRYYYFRFLKANGRHTEILLPVTILTFFTVVGT